jgi:hypothetical protein
MQSVRRMATAASLIIAAASVCCLLILGSSTAVPITMSDTAQATELSAQRRARPARTRIRIYAPYAYPGPPAVRHCTSWLEPEWRPSGTVIVPRMRCWWVPG